MCSQTRTTPTLPPDFPDPPLCQTGQCPTRLQELAFGGLSPQAEQRLDDLADEIDGKKKLKAKDSAAPVTGTRLVREWQGVMHEVTVLADGFEWQGRRYASLSAVARAITGTRWSGPLFFGLRKHGKQEARP